MTQFSNVKEFRDYMYKHEGDLLEEVDEALKEITGNAPPVVGDMIWFMLPFALEGLKQVMGLYDDYKHDIKSLPQKDQDRLHRLKERVKVQIKEIEKHAP